MSPPSRHRSECCHSTTGVRQFSAERLGPKWGGAIASYRPRVIGNGWNSRAGRPSRDAAMDGARLGEVAVAVPRLARRIGDGRVDAAATHFEARHAGFPAQSPPFRGTIGDRGASPTGRLFAAWLSDWCFGSTADALRAVDPATRGAGRTVGVSDGRTGARRQLLRARAQEG